MNRTMITATNTLNQLQNQLNTISNNISNSDTTGYKRKETSFTDLLVQQFDNQKDSTKEVGRLTEAGIRQGTGAKLSQSQTVLTQGSLNATDRSLDVALKKADLYFTVQATDGDLAYTRDGSFYLSPINEDSTQNMLVTADGNPVLDEYDNKIIVNGNVTDIVFSENGQLLVETEDQGNQSFELGVVSVKKPQFMEELGGNLLGMPANLDDLNVVEADVLTNLMGESRADISMEQGSLESSNVELATEMTDLITVQRQYQFQSRAITMADQMLGLVNSIR